MTKDEEFKILSQAYDILTELGRQTNWPQNVDSAHHNLAIVMVLYYNQHRNEWTKRDHG